MTEWTITIDNLADPDAKPATNANAVGIIGPSGATKTADQIRFHHDAVQFRLLDDDDEVYYVGFMVGNENEFAPLDDFGKPNAGCTSIQYLKEGSWETL